MKKFIKKTIHFILCIVLIFTVSVSSISISAAPFNSATDFMVGNYGIMLHYMPSMVCNGNVSMEEWNKVVNSFDTERFAENANELGADWVLFTISQNRARYPMPMDALKTLTGTQYGTDRDLINDLYVSLNQYGIKLFLYWIPGAPSSDASVAKILGATQKATDGYNYMLNDTVINNMEYLMKDISQRYGNKISGWWIDGCYNGVGFNNDIAERYAAALKSGNPNCVVAFNYSGTSRDYTNFECEDFSAGEIGHPQRPASDLTTRVPTSRYTPMGHQRHYLTFLGKNWGHPGLFFANTDQYADHVVNKVMAVGAACTFDIDVDAAGNINQDHFNQMLKIKKLHESMPAPPLVQPKPDWQPHEEYTPPVQSEPVVIPEDTTEPEEETVTEDTTTEDTKETVDTKKEEKPNDNSAKTSFWTVIIIVCAAVVIIAALLTAILLIRRRRKLNL